jgi:hypothetical protein
MPEIEIYTGRYEREHGQKPVGGRFWTFTLVSGSATAKDHFYNPGQNLTYDAALSKAKELAAMRKSVRIIVEP